MKCAFAIEMELENLIVIRFMARKKIEIREGNGSYAFFDRWKGIESNEGNEF